MIFHDRFIFVVLPDSDNKNFSSENLAIGILSV